jgi:hypothetical protein
VKRSPTSELEHELRRILDAYRDGTSPSAIEATRLWARLGVDGVAPAAAGSTMLRVIVGGALVATIATIAVTRSEAPREPAAPTQPDEPAAAPTVSAAAHTSSTPAPPTLAPSDPVPERTTVPIEHARPEPRTSIGTSPPAEESSLTDELALLERARIALGRGDPQDALRLLAEHERSFATGELVEERRALRILALCDAGKTVQGRAEARAFLAAHPAATLAGRTRSACNIED